MSARRLLALTAALLASCSWTASSNWHLACCGYSIDVPSEGEFVMEVHLNQLKAIGGDIHSAEFRLFVAERVKWHDICASGWALLPCVEDGSCIQRTSRSVTVSGRCVP